MSRRCIKAYGLLPSPEVGTWVDGGLPTFPSELAGIRRFNNFLRGLGFPLQTYLQRLKTEPILEQVRQKAVTTCFEAYEAHGFKPETMNIAINYIDLYLSRTRTQSHITMIMDFFDLFALACLHLASKIYETQVRSVDNWCATFNIQKPVLEEMESNLFQILRGNLKVPTIFTFLEYYKAKMNLTFFKDPTNTLIASLKETCFLEFLPSEVAAAFALFCSNCGDMTHLDEDTTQERVDDCAVMLFKMIQRTGVR